MAHALCAVADIDPFILDKERGWFWYETEPEIPEKPPEPPKPPPPPVDQAVIRMEPPKPNPLSVEWFQEEYPAILNQAIDDPSPENVARYRYATRVMLDKASNFAHEFKRQALLDPLLDESNRYPFASAARGSFQNFTIKQKQEAIRAIGQGAGLWVFLDDSCPFCEIQYPVVARTARERGLIVTYITPDGSRPSWIKDEDRVLKDQGQSSVLKIQVKPATVLVIPPKDLIVLTQGMLSQDLLEERILIAGDAAGLLGEEQRLRAFPMERGILTPDDIRQAGDAMQNNPDAMTSTIQELIQERY